MAYGLIADVGGTNIRLALVELASGSMHTVRTYLCADYAGLDLVLHDYLGQVGIPIAEACIAIAGPTGQDLIQMTNHVWKFSQQEIKRRFGFSQLHVINDYTAIALSLPILKENQKVQIGGNEPQTGHPIAVCGSGTGLGVAHLIHHAGSWLSLAGEGGHVDFAPQDAQEYHILTGLQKKYGHVSVERLLSGPGLTELYSAIAVYQGVTGAESLTAAEITGRALRAECPVCQETLAQFCRLLGSFAGNLGLTMATLGGVYIAGGIIPRFVEFLKQSDFRDRFEDKGRFQHFMQRIPVFVITEKQPGLLGAGVYLRQAAGHTI
jgi:glucokinase